VSGVILLPGDGEQLANFLVACLGKIFVPLADGVEAFRENYRYHLVGLALHLATGGSRNDRRRDYDSRGIQLSQRGNRREQVDPVAMPSSTPMMVLPPTSNGGRPVRYAFSRRCYSISSSALTASIISSGIRSALTTSPLNTRTTPEGDGAHG
jgi:hypothetical protein